MYTTLVLEYKLIHKTMITKDNIKEVFDSMGSADVIAAMQAPCDYIAIELNVFNAGYIVYINAYHYNDKVKDELEESGNLFLDKDDFLRLFEESGSDNPAIKEYM